VADAAAPAAQDEDLYRPEGPGARILVVASEWLSWHGGLSTFNRELCTALAACGQQVLCLVPAANVEELADAATRGIGLLSAAAEPYADDAVRLRRRPLLDGLEPQVIIGHGRVTGPQARSLRDDFFPNAARVHVIHTYAGHIEWFKQPGPHETRTQKAADRADHERFLAEGADVVAAVGSLLTREAQSLLGRNVVELIPGVGELACDLPRALPPTRRCLLAGRAEDRDLKGLDIAATAFGLLPRTDAREQSQLVIQGAPLEGADALAADLAEMAGSRLKIHVAPYTEHPKQLALELGRASIAIMPSRREGFGLSGLEAISAGIPVLVSANSGLGELLADLGGTAADCVVVVDDDLAADSKRWSERIAALFDDRQAAFERAAEVRRQVSERCVWAQAAARLLGELALEPVEMTSAVDLSVRSAEPLTREAFELPARNLSFAGHLELLSALDLALESGRAVQILAGPPGVGKTQIAVELAWRRRTLYDVVWTVNAASHAAISADLSRLARQLELADHATNPEEQVAAARRWLAEHDGWFVLIDGLEDVRLVEDWLPTSPLGDVLVTTRERDWEHLGDTTIVAPWSRGESIAFLLTRTGDPNTELANKLSQALGGLPLALSMAAAYMDERGSGMASYLEELQAVAPQLLDVDARSSSETAVDATVRPVWEELSKEPLALELLNLAAFYAPDRIPRDLLTGFLRLPESEQAEGDLDVDDRAIAASMRFALLSPQDDGFVLHPLIAEHARKRLGEQAGVWAVQACKVVLSAFSAPTPTASGLDLVPHAVTATRFAMSDPDIDVADGTYELVVRLRTLASRLLAETGQLADADLVLGETAEFLAHTRSDAGDVDPILGVAVELERARLAALIGDPKRSGAFSAHALSLARSAGVRSAPAPRLSCEMLLEVLPADPAIDGGDAWYRALSFRALEVSRQVLVADIALGSAMAPGLQLRLRVLRYLVAAGQFDDAVASGAGSIPVTHVTDDPSDDVTDLIAAIDELTATALDHLGDSEAARAVRRRSSREAS
jgi:glycosyltransferase involved in cell wall biosynthesis